MNETTATNGPLTVQPATAGPDEISLLDLWRVLVKRRKMTALVFFAASIATLSLLLSKTYQAKTTIIPLESSKTSRSTALATLGGMAGISLGESTPTEKLVVVLNSRTVAENAIKKLNLLPELFTPPSIPFLRSSPTMEGAVKKLQEDIISSDSKSNLITVAVEHGNPERTAQIANAFIEELHHFMKSNALTLAKKKRILLEQQIGETKDNMKVAEEKLKDYQQNKRLLTPDLQAEAAIKGCPI